VRKNIARYINHACKPNAESDVSARKRKVVIRAIKNIEPGEEINYDYGKDYFKIFLKPIGCKCDACEKKRKKQRAEARAEKAKLKLKAEKKATKARGTEGKALVVNAMVSAHARGTGKVTKTKSGRTQPLDKTNVKTRSGREASSQ
jgi:hypothetical protein